MHAHETRPGGRHEADVAGAFSEGWDFRNQRRHSVALDGPLWERARMSEQTRALLLGWLSGAWAAAA